MENISSSDALIQIGNLEYEINMAIRGLMTGKEKIELTKDQYFDLEGSEHTVKEIIFTKDDNQIYIIFTTNDSIYNYQLNIADDEVNIYDRISILGILESIK